MPSRRGILAIVLFWCATMGVVGYRDVWPRLFGDAPPTAWIDLSDEAAQSVPVRWTITRNGIKIGTLATLMQADTNATSFEFISTYRDLQLDADKLKCTIPRLVQTIRVSREGRLLAQSLHGSLQASVLGISLGEATARVEATVRGRLLVGECELESPFTGRLQQSLTPTPVPEGQVLNPLQPVNRLRGVSGGQRWVIHEVNPLHEALLALGQSLVKKGLGTGLNLAGDPGERAPMIATVAPEPVSLTRTRGDVPCWLIECRGDRGTLMIWVAVADGRILRQEATSQDETIRLERDD